MIARAASLQAADAPAVILASASPARSRLLRAAGVKVTQHSATIDEETVRAALQAEGLAPGAAAVALAELKAHRIAGQAPAGALVLGADQILSCEERWLGKPANLAEARAQLEQLAGRRHDLATAVVAFRNGARIWHQLSIAKLWLRACSASFLDGYLSAIGEAALTSVGAYQVEGLGAQLLARIEGDQFAIQGLPLLEVLDFLRAQGALAR
jgi:nucleoside triphosphate pyrophosphatase